MTSLCILPVADTIELFKPRNINIMYDRQSRLGIKILPLQHKREINGTHNYFPVPF